MNRITKINPHMFNLLIEREMDDFSVTEARDALLESGVLFPSKEDARKYVYRQLLSFEGKGWLLADGLRRDKRYNLTAEFKALAVEPRTFRDKKMKVDSSARLTESELNTLLQEKKLHEGELAITLGEIEEYQSLLSRFPSNKKDLQPLYDAAKEHSAKLLGKINALNNYVHISKDKALKC
ncbi:TPA: hypothetical protein KD887_000065 [Vibrio parahaemolyticus]|nr:hypothetical protein [Vibrio parahaemolyticus]